MPMARATSVSAVGVGEHSDGREQDDVVGPLTDDLRVADRVRAVPEHAELLVAHLPAVAVRAVQDVAGPALGEPGNVGQLVAQAGGHEQPAGRDPLPVGEQDLEAGGPEGDEVGRLCRLMTPP